MQAIEIEIAGAKETLATKQDILILQHEMAEMRAELRHEIAGLVTHGRLYAAITAQTTLLLGIAHFFVTHLPH